MGKKSSSSPSTWDKIAKRVSRSHGSASGAAGGSGSGARTAVLSQRQKMEIEQAQKDMDDNSYNTSLTAYTQAVSTLNGYYAFLKNDPEWGPRLGTQLGLNTSPTYGQSSQSSQSPSYYDYKSGRYYDGNGKWLS